MRATDFAAEAPSSGLSDGQLAKIKGAVGSNVEWYSLGSGEMRNIAEMLLDQADRYLADKDKALNERDEARAELADTLKHRDDDIRFDVEIATEAVRAECERLRASHMKWEQAAHDASKTIDSLSVALAQAVELLTYVVENHPESTDTPAITAFLAEHGGGK